MPLKKIIIEHQQLVPTILNDMKYNHSEVTNNCKSSLDNYGAKLDTALAISSIY
jgi:hypothetical protein